MAAANHLDKDIELEESCRRESLSEGVANELVMTLTQSDGDITR